MLHRYRKTIKAFEQINTTNKSKNVYKIRTNHSKEASINELKLATSFELEAKEPMCC